MSDLLSLALDPKYAKLHEWLRDPTQLIRYPVFAETGPRSDHIKRVYRVSPEVESVSEAPLSLTQAFPPDGSNGSAMSRLAEVQKLMVWEFAGSTFASTNYVVLHDIPLNEESAIPITATLIRPTEGAIVRALSDDFWWPRWRITGNQLARELINGPSSLY